MTCVRGASALQEMLRRTPGHSLRVFVVWEPVLWTDLTPPLSSVLARVSDPRARQFWDRGRLVSAELLSVPGAPPTGPRADPPELDGILWDAVALYPPGARWDETLPAPDSFNGPVVAVIEEIERRLSSSSAPPGR